MKRVKNTISKTLAMLLAVLMIVGMLPTVAFATEANNVYISVSYDGRYIDDQNGAPLVYVPVSFDELAAIDLDAYNLGDYKYDENGDGTYDITALHLVIYAHENIYGGDFSEVTFTGSPGSSYFQGGIFGFDENLNYYLNGEYPLASAGWGATSDQIVLEAGDFIDMASFSSWDFFQDSNYGFHFFAGSEGTFVHDYAAEAGTALPIKLVRSYSGMGTGAIVFDEAGYEVSYGTALYDAVGTVTTDDSGCAEVTFPSAGTWYLWADGGYGMEYPDSVVSAPAFAKVTVTERPEDVVEALIDAIGAVTLESESAITAAREAYDKLTDEQKAAVENYADLEAAEKKLAELKAEAEAEAKTAAELVMDKIDAVGTVTVHSWKKIKDARYAYDALIDAEKKFVTNEGILTAAEEKIEELYAAAAETDYKPIYESTGKYIKGLGTPTVGSTGGEWMVIDLTRSGYSCPEGYYKNVVEYVVKNINSKGQLHDSKSTDNSRVILGLTAAGYNVTNVGGHNLLQGINELSYLKKQGINGPIWALIALDSHDYEVPAGGDVTRDKLIDTIMAAQHDDGGWALSADKKKASDPDLTGMAIQALAPYYNDADVNYNDADVNAAVDKALECLSEMQYDNGGFGSMDGACSESCAQVVVALTALDIDPEEDSRFIKNGMSVVDAMCLFAVEGGGFAHVPNNIRNGMATEQSYYALTAYQRLLDGKSSLYDMTDVVVMSVVKAVEEQIDAIGKVTEDSGDSIKAARAAYNKLTAAEKEEVTNYSKLTAAEAAYEEIAAVQNVIDLIAAIGKVTASSETKIERARAAYNKLTVAQKKLVDNYDDLLDAEDELEEVLEEAEIEYVEDLIASIGKVTKDSKQKIERARKAYDALSATDKKKVGNLSVLAAAEEAYKKLAETPDSNKTTTTTTTVKDLTVFAGKVDEQIENIADDATTGEILDVILAYETLTEAEKAAIGKKQTVEFMKKQIAEMLQTDSKTGIGASGMDWNIQVVVSDPLNVTAVQEMQEKLGDNTMLGLWDIHLSDVLLSQEVQPDGSVLIKIPLALLGDYSVYNGLAVVHYADDGTVEYLNSTVIGDCIAFNTVEFSYFAVVGYEGMSPLDNTTNDASAPVIPWVIAGCCALALCAVVVFLIRKNKKELVGKYAE